APHAARPSFPTRRSSDLRLAPSPPPSDGCKRAAGVAGLGGAASVVPGQAGRVWQVQVACRLNLLPWPCVHRARPSECDWRSVKRSEEHTSALQYVKILYA